MKTKIGAVIILFSFFLFIFSGCRKIDNFFNEDPDLKTLQDGFKVSAAVGYCASIAHTVFTKNLIPDNVSISFNKENTYSSSAIIYIDINAQNPLPFNKQVGDIVIAAVWDTTFRSGVMSILFADINLLEASFDFQGIYTIPFLEKEETEDILAIYAQQDINSWRRKRYYFKPKFNPSPV
jgi:hypothetical protein